MIDYQPQQMQITRPSMVANPGDSYLNQQQQQTSNMLPQAQQQHQLNQIFQGQQQQLPPNIVVPNQQQQNNDLIGYYFGSISRETAEWILKNHAGNLDGTYLLRSSGDDFVLSLLVVQRVISPEVVQHQQQQHQIAQFNRSINNQLSSNQTIEVLHYKIVETEDSFVALHGQVGNEKFATIDELIDKAEGVATKPRFPIQRQSLEYQILPPTYWGLTVDQVRLAILLKAKQWGFPLLSSIFQQQQQASTTTTSNNNGHIENSCNLDEQNKLSGDNHNNNNITTTLNNETIRTLIYKSLHEFQPWFHGNISREEAEKRIEEGQPRDGRFLVRERDNLSYAMCFSHKRTAKHYRIDILPTGELAIRDGRKFTSLMALVSHYTIMSDGLWCGLTEACIRPTSASQQQQQQQQQQHLPINYNNEQMLSQQNILNQTNISRNLNLVKGNQPDVNYLFLQQQNNRLFSNNSNNQNIYCTALATTNNVKPMNAAGSNQIFQPTNVTSSNNHTTCHNNNNNCNNNKSLVATQSATGLATIRGPIKEWLQTINNKWTQLVTGPKNGHHHHQTLNNFLFGSQNPLNHHCRQHRRHHHHHHNHNHDHNNGRSHSCNADSDRGARRCKKGQQQQKQKQSSLDNSCTREIQNSYYLNHKFSNPIQQAILSASQNQSLPTANFPNCNSNNLSSNCNCCPVNQNNHTLTKNANCLTNVQPDLYTLQKTLLKNASAQLEINNMNQQSNNGLNLGFSGNGQCFIGSPLFAIQHQQIIKAASGFESTSLPNNQRKNSQQSNSSGGSQTGNTAILAPVEEERLISPARSDMNDNQQQQQQQVTNNFRNSIVNENIYGSQLSTVIMNENAGHSSTSSSSGQATNIMQQQHLNDGNNNLISELKLQQQKLATSRIQQAENDVYGKNFMFNNFNSHTIKPAKTINSDLTSATKTNHLNDCDRPTIMCGQHAGSAYRYTNCPNDENSMRLCTHHINNSNNWQQQYQQQHYAPEMHRFVGNTNPLASLNINMNDTSGYRVSADDLNLPHRATQLAGPAAMTKFVQFQDGQCLRTHRDARSIQMAYLTALRSSTLANNNSNNRLLQQHLNSSFMPQQASSTTTTKLPNIKRHTQQTNRMNQSQGLETITDHNVSCQKNKMNDDIDLIDCNDGDLGNFNFKYDPKLIKSSSIETLCSLGGDDDRTGNLRNQQDDLLELDRFKTNSELISTLGACWFGTNDQTQGQLGQQNQFNSILNPIPINQQQDQEKIYNLVYENCQTSGVQQDNLSSHADQSQTSFSTIDNMKRTQDLDELTTALLADLTTSLKAQVDLKNKRAGFY